MKLEQAFWGNDKMGYRLLGVSSLPLSSSVESLCNAIGTPDGFSELKPFLFSVPRGEMLYMVCCQAGILDASGRKTIFFHVLIGNRIQADAMCINAFSLYESGYFSSTIKKPLEALIVPTSMNAKSSPVSSFSWDGKDMAIVSRKPENALLQGLLGNEVNAVPWSGFSFRPLDGYKLYAISEFVLRPTDRKCYSPEGKLLSSEIYQPNKATSRNETSPQMPSRNFWQTSRILLVISLLANLLLVYLLLKNRDEPITKPNTTNLSPTAIAEQPKPKPSPPVTQMTRKDTLKELKSKFAHEARITDWDKSVSEFPRLKDMSNNPNVAEYKFLQKVKQYINFVNHNILTSQTQGEQL